MKLTTKILIAMMLGILLGVTFNLLKESNLVEISLVDIFDSFVIEGLFEVIGKIFVASLKMMVVPLVFISLVLGTSALGNNARMGPMAGKAIILYLITTSIAISLAIIMANVVDPGVGMDRSTDVEFIGKEALIKIKDEKLDKRLMMFTLKDSKPGEPLLLHDEPIYIDNKIIGRTTSGNYSFCFEKNLSFGYVNSGNTYETLKDKNIFIEVEKQKYAVDVLEKPLNEKKYKL